ncbi:hypothetical protein M409DRAFT_27034 [Zasmidium cellare ATCC 36951]|uniref:F-box domain-containing protein n=1 Tax=Zasmidium cellare ATCC 36951 TaxID=1080233 RepID=A0A6A6C9T0_ZASCE|nr:uncharacterized protein M409DRAFT_27034 [Zasmidium cellare ATCC 36951]KAF2162409.1 hypothetical protein M409DRAFT_27034 [Zasmidium cellare ATCC 36951]
MATAKDKVFATPELLEAILLEVDDMQTLLLSQRVDKTFKAAIDSSIHFQRALWFKPMPSTASLPRDKVLRNSLIGKFRRRLGIERMVQGSFQRLHDDGSESEVDFEWKSTKIITLSVIKRRKGSWRKMLPFQPGLATETWLVGTPFGHLRYMPEKWDDDTVHYWKIDFHPPIAGVIGLCGRYMNLGEPSQALTMGEVFDPADARATSLKRACMKSLCDELRGKYGQISASVERWWMSEREEEQGVVNWPPGWDKEAAWVLD